MLAIGALLAVDATLLLGAGSGPGALLAILAFGYPAIIIPALAAVPTMFVILIMITKG